MRKILTIFLCMVALTELLFLLSRVFLANAYKINTPPPLFGGVKLVASPPTTPSPPAGPSYWQHMFTFFPPQPLSADICTAWEDAGAKSGWMTNPDEEWRPARVDPQDDLPAFRFRRWNQIAISQLPPPDQYFGLDLQGANLTNSGLNGLSRFTQLQRLNLSGAHLTDANLKDLAGLENLCGLDLSNTQVTDAGLSELDSLTQLTYLDLTDDQVTDAGLKKLKRLTQLWFLGIDGTQVTNAGVTDFQQALPNVQFER